MAQPTCTGAAGQALTGRFVSRDRGPWEPYAFGQPLHVSPGREMAIAICNQNNHALGRAHWPSLRSLIPNLVGSVGAQASLTVLIQNSANVDVGDELVLGERTIAADGTLSEPSPTVEAALVGKVISGPIGDGARIDVRLRDSANVLLTAVQSHLHIGGGSLIEQLLQASTANTPSAAGACININVDRSGRVAGDRGVLTIGGGQLSREIVQHGLRNSHVTVREVDVANVAAARVRLFKGELIDEIIDAGPLNGNRIEVHLQGVGNVRAASLQIDDAELIDEIVDTTQVSGSLIDVRLTDTGNVTLTEDLSIREGELIDETVDVENVDASSIEVRFVRSANVSARNVDIVEGELIDEMLDAEGHLLRSRIDIAVEDTANVQADVVEIADGGLVDEVLDALGGSDVRAVIGISRSANVQGLAGAPSRSVSILRGDLLDEVLDFGERIALFTGRIDIGHTGNVRGRSILLDDARLLAEVLDAPVVERSNVDVDVRQSANAAFGDALTLRGGSAQMAPVFSVGAVDGASRLGQVITVSGQRGQVRP